MVKKLITLVMVLLFMGVGLVACSGISLANYKSQAKAELDAYAVQSDYSEANWQAVLDIIADGKAAIEAAGSKDAVDTMKEGTKKSILEVDMSFVESEIDDMVDCSSFHYLAARNSLGTPIMLNYSNASASFECSIENGWFYSSLTDNCGRVITVEPGKGFWWMPDAELRAKQSFIKILLKIDDYILGYAIIELNAEDQLGNSFKARNLKSALFPKVNDEHQSISESQIKNIFEKIKGENKL